MPLVYITLMRRFAGSEWDTGAKTLYPWSTQQPSPAHKSDPEGVPSQAMTTTTIKNINLKLDN